jgi:baculoviral IAP repeat-containing protein 6
MWEDGEITWTKDTKGDLEVVPPLYSYFKKLTKQSEAFQGGAMRLLGEGGEDGDELDDTMIQGTSLCGDIIAARDVLERAIALLGLSSSNLESNSQAPQANHSNHLPKKGKGKDMSINIDNVYIDACERLAFKHVSLYEASSNNDAGLNYTNYNYASQLTQSQNATRLPKSRLHLVKELAVTATSLPAGVWVRVDEVRNDAMCVLLTSIY